MKKYLHYIIDTFLCRFSKHFVFKNAKTKWLTYHLGSQENRNVIAIDSSKVHHSSFNVDGYDNQVIIKNQANMSYSHIKVSGNNNSVVFDGCSGIISLTIRGNNCKVSVGKNTSMEDLYMICMGNNNTILIGEDCMFSSNVEVWNSDTHLITDLEGTPINHNPAPVTIGNHVWLGKHAKVLKNVSIGDNAVIGMSSVVTKAVPRNSIAAGNPAKVIRDNIKWEKKYITRWFGDNLK